MEHSDNVSKLRGFIGYVIKRNKASQAQSRNSTKAKWHTFYFVLPFMYSMKITAFPFSSFAPRKSTIVSMFSFFARDKAKSSSSIYLV